MFHPRQPRGPNPAITNARGHRRDTGLTKTFVRRECEVAIGADFDA
jgi:hypothetical protein